MKKNISINVGGIIFHIEEDGYDKLKNYLASINRYFSTYEDSTEIIADIESRIAEIFLAKLTEFKQVITSKDVDDLIETMGRISDFEAAEEIVDETYSDEPHSGTNSREERKEPKAKTKRKAFEEERGEGQKKIYRDEKRKLIGGVCAGIAHYFNFDPLWIRLFFLLPFFGLILKSSMIWVLLSIYIVAWVVIPGSDDLEEDESVRRLFRDGEDGVLGGVASGIASFFGLDVNLIRLLFVIGTFLGGVGIIVYLVVWFITPEARSITEKMQMKGEPITLSNIEQKIKDSLNLDEDEEENIFAKILLFPFRLISMIIENLDTDLKPIARFFFTVLTTLLGIILVFISFIVTIVLVVLLSVIFGMIGFQETSSLVSMFGFPFDASDLSINMFQSSFPPVGLLFAFITVWVPFIFVGILGLSLIAKRIITSPLANWGFLGIWILALIGAGVTIPIFVTEFQTEGTFKKTTTYQPPAEKIKFGMYNNDFEGEITKIKLTLSGHDKEEIELVERFESRGKTRQFAIENAKNIDYNFQVSDSIFVFDSNFKLKDNTPYRGQRLDLRMYIPYNKEFILSEDLSTILNYYPLYSNGYSFNQLGSNIWVFNEDGLNCKTCKETEASTSESENSNTNTRDFDIKDFDELRISGAFNLELRGGKGYKVSANVDRGTLENLIVEKNGDKLWIRQEDENSSRAKSNMVNLVITVPSLTDIKLEGAIKSKITNINTNDLNLRLLGAVECDAHTTSNELRVHVTGASKLNLKGKTNEMSLGVAGASEVNAFELDAKVVKVAAYGISNARVFASRALDIKSAFGSNVDYKGDPKLIKKDNNLEDDENIEFDF
ncbi:PspC domain-containing protein [Flexithrix dorotheae]|uniref:PspC domain-containing protein n=1 Tax=Flexithrix dorotheae TaxID=70993 RepID=UPI000371EB35|nr:PspC domain-containing protein [Flexithrix dorotheae]